MAPIILGYWPIRGLAQPIRYLLEFTGTKYEEKFYTKREEWTEDKKILALDLPNLPYYIDGDLKITESGAIIKHIARKTRLDGTTEEQHIRIDVATGVISDIIRAFIMLCYNDQFETLKAAYLNDIATPVGKMSTLLGSRNFIAGDQITYIDFIMFEAIERLVFIAPKCLDSFKDLQDYQKRICELPTIKKYRASSYFQNMKTYFNGNTAKFGGGKY